MCRAAAHTLTTAYRAAGGRPDGAPGVVGAIQTFEQLVHWRAHIETQPIYDPERECFVVLFLNTRRRIRGHQFVTIGTLDIVLVHPREVFRVAIAVPAAAIVLLHNHPSGDPAPSEADIQLTRQLIQAGRLLRIEVLDHVIIGRPNHCSLKEFGLFA